MKYRKKPVVIEAFKFTSEVQSERKLWPDWALECVEDKLIIRHFDWLEINVKQPFEQQNEYVTCELDDYVIKGVKGEIYPCKPDIFEMTYDLVGE